MGRKIRTRPIELLSVVKKNEMAGEDQQWQRTGPY
jgi:hypothetical protein